MHCYWPFPLRVNHWFCSLPQMNFVCSWKSTNSFEAVRILLYELFLCVNFTRCIGGEKVCCFSAFTVGISGALGCSLFPSVTGEMCVMQIAQLIVITCRLSQTGNPSMAVLEYLQHIIWIGSFLASSHLLVSMSMGKREHHAVGWLCHYRQ